MTPTVPSEHLLLIKARHNQEQLEPVLDQLSKIGYLDKFTLRQRLIGTGLTQLAKGTKTQLLPLTTILRQYHIEQWLVQLNPPEVIPQTIDNITINEQQIVFSTTISTANPSRAKLTLPKGSAVRAIVADISGQIAEKQVKRLLVHTTYSGTTPTPMSNAELQREIFKQAPVIDLYWNDTNSDTTVAVRIFPGSFDHRQLGDKAGLSRNGNLLNLLGLVSEYAASININFEFGLGFLPPCPVKKTAPGEKDKDNLKSLTCYGALLLDIDAIDAKSSINTADNGNQTTNATLGSSTVLPVAEELLNTITTNAIGAEEPQTSSGDGTSPTTQPQSKKSLPTPPAVETRSGLQLFFSGWQAIAIVSGILVVIITKGQKNLPTLIYTYGLNTGIIPALLCTASLWGAIHFWRLKRRIENTPTSKARSAAMGMIEVHGNAKRLYSLVSPISQLPCVYYCLKKYKRSKRNDNWRLSQITTSGTVPFLLEDDTGTIRIDPHGAKLSPQFSTEGFPGQSNILFSSGGESSQYEKWKEEVLHEGCNLYIIGFAHTLGASESGSIRNDVGQKLRDLKTDHAAMMRYDKDGDGNIDTAEWDQARKDMEKQALQEKLVNGQQRSNKQLVIGRPPQKGLPFIIAETESEQKLTERYSWYIPALLILAASNLIWALYCGGHYFLHL